MSLEEFSALRPAEFSAVWVEWQEKENMHERQEWERMRLLATISIQPHIKDKLTPSELLPFPWDKEPQNEEPALTAEERRQKAEEALRRLG